MKKTIALLLVLTMIFATGCSAAGAGGTTAAPAATATPEPTEESHRVEMSGLMTDILDDDQRSFFTTLKSNPPVMATVYLDQQYPLAVELDIDNIRELCSELLELNISAKTDIAVTGSDNSLSLIRENGESITLNFNGDNLKVGEDIYELANSNDFWDTMRDIAEEAQEEAQENKAAFEDGTAFNAEFDEEYDSRLVRCVSAPAEKQGENDGDFQTVSVKITVTNVGQHLLMSAKCIAEFVDGDGRVVAKVPVDMDFNNAPVYIGEAREYTLTQKLYNATGADLSGDALLAQGALIEVVSINAPNEAGH